MSEKFPHLPWHEVCDRVAPATFRLYTDDGMGTGFLISVGKSGDTFMAFLATAYHVVQGAVSGSAMRICDQHGKEVVHSKGGNMAITEVGDDLDLALVIVQSKQELFSKDLLLPVLPPDYVFKRGTEIGWMGYPGITEPDLCFFHGHVAALIQQPHVYLVDGVAINGVSGGPVFDDRCHLAGLVSAYLPNQLALPDGASRTLPGVAMMVPINAIFLWLQFLTKSMKVP
jgi:hypothetical protein